MALLNLSKNKDRRFFDEKNIPDDVWSVLKTASVLSVGEFRVFGIAYREWFGEEGDEDTIERYFTRYMFNEIVPPWVRHFCQRIQRLDDDGTLVLADLGIVAPTASSEQKWRGIEASFWIFGGLLILILIGDIAARMSDLKCAFPPCA